jgi:hypothetical protein
MLVWFSKTGLRLMVPDCVLSPAPCLILDSLIG